MMTVYLYKNAINNFTIYCEQQLVQEMDSVTYTLKLSNVLGYSTVFIKIVKQGKCFFFLHDFCFFGYTLVVSSTLIYDFSQYSRN